jgi:branched-chain amino acid transport system permease protein
LTLFLQQVANGVAVGSLYGLFAVGFGLVFATMNILSIAHGTIATWGAIMTLWAVEALELPFLVALVIGCLGTGLIGVMVDQIGFQPLRRRGTDGFFGVLIASIGLWIILGQLALIATEATWHTFPAEAFPRVYLDFGAITIPTFHMATVGFAVAVTAMMYVLLHRTRSGAAMRAVGWNMDSASLSGVNSRKVIIQTSFIGAVIVGLAGALAGLSTNQVSFILGEGLLLKGFAAVVIGGFGDVRGALLGGIIVGLSEVLGAQYVSSAFRDAVTYGLFILFLLYRPRGILGTTEEALKV